MMKKHTFFFIILFVCSCKEKSKNENQKVFASSTGRMNSLLVVIENKYWKTDIGKTLKKTFSKPIFGLPQEEYPFDITQISPKFFGKMFRLHRNILKIKICDTISFESKKNVFAKPQQMIIFKSINSEKMQKLIENYQNYMVQIFQKSDLKNIQIKNAKKTYPENYFKIFKKNKMYLQIPNAFRVVENTENFLWMRKHLSGGIAQGDGRSALLMYVIPMLKNKKNLKEKIIKIRDSIGKKYLKGSKKNSYMITEKAFVPKLYKTFYGQNICYITKGKWELYNDFMAGPFQNYIFQDIKNKRWIVLEGFVYAPSVNKRDYMFELEAVIKTLHWK